MAIRARTWSAMGSAVYRVSPWPSRAMPTPTEVDGRVIVALLWALSPLAPGDRERAVDLASEAYLKAHEAAHAQAG